MFGPRLRIALLPPELALVHFLVVEYLVEILNQLLLAAYPFDLAARHDVEDIVDVVAVEVLVLAQLRR